MRTIVTILMLLAVGVCPEQQFEPLDGLDESKIVMDPATHKPLVLGRLYGYTGRMMTIYGWFCDPDIEDPNSVDPHLPPQALRAWRIYDTEVDLPLNERGEWSIQVSPETDGWHYYSFAWTDGIDARAGTVAVWTQTNRPPTGGCGSRP